MVYQEKRGPKNLKIKEKEKKLKTLNLKHEKKQIFNL